MTTAHPYLFALCWAIMVQFFNPQNHPKSFSHQQPVIFPKTKSHLPCLKHNGFPLSVTLFVWVCVVLGFELRIYTFSHSTNHFVASFFEIGSHELFARAGFEL
jgi:hypothetical protein